MKGVKRYKFLIYNKTRNVMFNMISLLHIKVKRVNPEFSSQEKKIVLFYLYKMMNVH